MPTVKNSTDTRANASNALLTTPVPVRTTKRATTVNASASCLAKEYHCTTNNECIDRSWLCDDEEDCEDGQDESDALCGRNRICFVFLTGRLYRYWPEE